MKIYFYMLILNLFICNLFAQFSSDTNTIGLWNFSNAGAVDTLYDSSNNDNHGVITGALWIQDPNPVLNSL